MTRVKVKFLLHGVRILSLGGTGVLAYEVNERVDRGLRGICEVRVSICEFRVSVGVPLRTARLMGGTMGESLRARHKGMAIEDVQE